MNEKVSEDFNYFTATILGNPLAVVGDFFDGLGALGDRMFPLSKKYDAPTPKAAVKAKPAKKSFNPFGN